MQLRVATEIGTCGSETSISGSETGVVFKAAVFKAADGVVLKAAETYNCIWVSAREVV